MQIESLLWLQQRCTFLWLRSVGQLEAIQLHASDQYVTMQGEQEKFRKC